MRSVDAMFRCRLGTDDARRGTAGGVRGAATATTKGAGRNVATAELVEELLDRCVCDEETCLGWGINAAAATRAKELLDASLKKSGRR